MANKDLIYVTWTAFGRNVFASMKCGNRIAQLEALRFCAIFVIMMSHMDFIEGYVGGEIWKRFFHNPTWGVDYFFIVSGFGIYLSHLKDKTDIISLESCIRFAVERIRRIYPLYLIMGISMVPCSIIKDARETILAKAIIKAILKSIGFTTLLQSALGIECVSRTLNGVCWFLSSIFVCYMFIPYILKIVDSLSEKINDKIMLGIGGCITCVTFILVLSNVFILIENRTLFDDLFRDSPYIRIWYMILGVFIGIIYNELYKNFEYKKIQSSIVEIIFLLFWIT